MQQILSQPKQHEIPKERETETERASSTFITTADGSSLCWLLFLLLRQDV